MTRELTITTLIEEAHVNNERHGLSGYLGNCKSEEEELNVLLDLFNSVLEHLYHEPDCYYSAAIERHPADKGASL